MKKYALAVLIVLAAVHSFDKGAAADEIWLKNGDHLSGKIVSMAADKLVFNTGYAEPSDRCSDHIALINRITDTAEIIHCIFKKRRIQKRPLLIHEPGKPRRVPIRRGGIESC